MGSTVKEMTKTSTAWRQDFNEEMCKLARADCKSLCCKYASMRGHDAQVFIEDKNGFVNVAVADMAPAKPELPLHARRDNRVIIGEARTEAGAWMQLALHILTRNGWSLEQLCLYLSMSGAEEKTDVIAILDEDLKHGLNVPLEQKLMLMRKLQEKD